MDAYVETALNCPPAKVWAKVQTSALLLEVASPLVRILPVDAPAFPERWTEGTTIRCRSYLFGFIPLGTRTLRFDRVDAFSREIRTHETDPLVRTWNHCICVAQRDDGSTLYSDSIKIEAGPLTPLVWLFAQGFYRHRQRRWRRIARRLAEDE